MTQQTLDELESLLLHIDEFVHAHMCGFWFFIILFFVIPAVIDGIRLYRLNKRRRIYYCCGTDSDLCKYKIYWSKKLKAQIIVPEIYEDCFAEADDFKKEYWLVKK